MASRKGPDVNGFLIEQSLEGCHVLGQEVHVDDADEHEGESESGWWWGRPLKQTRPDCAGQAALRPAEGLVEFVQALRVKERKTRAARKTESAHEPVVLRGELSEYLRCAVYGAFAFRLGCSSDGGRDEHVYHDPTPRFSTDHVRVWGRGTREPVVTRPERTWRRFEQGHEGPQPAAAYEHVSDLRQLRRQAFGTHERGQRGDA